MTRANFCLSLFNYGIFTFPLQNCLNSASSIDAPLGIFILFVLEVKRQVSSEMGKYSNSLNMVPPVQLDPHSQLLSHPLIRNAESLPSYYTTVFKVFFAAFAILMSLRLYVRASSCLLTCASLMAGWVCKNSSTSL